MNSGPRIFQIGFNKCGTTSLHRFFLANGLASVHWENGEIALRFFARMARGEDPFADYPQAVAFTDMIKVRGSLLEPYKHVDYIHRWYPDAYFILNTRNASDWIESRVKHGLVPHYCEALGLPDEASVRAYWLREWYHHHAAVLEYFAAMPERLLVFDIDRDAPAKLARFLAPSWTLDPSRFGRHNRTAGGAIPAREPSRSVTISSASFELLGDRPGQEQPLFVEIRPRGA